jgi:hypothetical protein
MAARTNNTAQNNGVTLRPSITRLARGPSSSSGDGRRHRLKILHVIGFLKCSFAPMMRCFGCEVRSFGASSCLLAIAGAQSGRPAERETW